jgi:hypothetical protein
MEKEFTIETLIEKFTEHSATFEQQYKVENEEDYLTYHHFNLPMALLTLSKEIKKLKDKI